MDFDLTDEEKSFLLDLARQSIKQFLKKGEPAPVKPYFSQVLETKTGAFVTLRKNDALRGCIGYVQGFKPLQEAIADLAISAAFNDPRFSPLTDEEFKQIDIEISVLSPLTEVSDPSEIVIGRDGLLISKGGTDGLLLPQVASEHNWDVKTFLEQTCQKAFLPPDAWQDKNCQIYRFSAIIFSEDDYEE